MSKSIYLYLFALTILLVGNANAQQVCPLNHGRPTDGPAPITNPGPQILLPGKTAQYLIQRVPWWTLKVQVTCTISGGNQSPNIIFNSNAYQTHSGPYGGETLTTSLINLVGCTNAYSHDGGSLSFTNNSGTDSITINCQNVN